MGQSFDPHLARVRRRLMDMVHNGDMGHECRKLEIYASKERLNAFPVNDYRHGTGVAELLEKFKEVSEDHIAGMEPYKTVTYTVKGYFGENAASTKFVTWSLSKEPEDDDDTAGFGGNPRDFHTAALKHEEIQFKQLQTAIDSSQNRLRAELDSCYDTIREQQDRISGLLNERTGWIIKEQQMLNQESDRKLAKDKADAENRANQELFEFGKQAGMLLLMHTISGNPKQLPSPQIDYQSKLLGLKTLADGLSDNEIRAAMPHMTPEQGMFIMKCNLAAKAAKGEEQKDADGNIIPAPLPTLEEINAFWDSMLDDPDRAQKIMGGLHVLKQGYFTTMMQQRALTRPKRPQLSVVKDS